MAVVDDDSLATYDNMQLRQPGQHLGMLEKDKIWEKKLFSAFILFIDSPNTRKNINFFFFKHNHYYFWAKVRYGWKEWLFIKVACISYFSRDNNDRNVLSILINFWYNWFHTVKELKFFTKKMLDYLKHLFLIVLVHILFLSYDNTKICIYLHVRICAVITRACASNANLI